MSATCCECGWELDYDGNCIACSEELLLDENERLKAEIAELKQRINAGDAPCLKH